MDIREDPYAPIIMDKPFLCNVRILIDVKRGTLSFKTGEEVLYFVMTTTG